MIHLITLNPAIDHFIYTDAIEVGATNYIKNDEMVFGGKAINVAHVLQELNEECKLVTTTDIQFSTLINSQLKNIDNELFSVKQIRINTKLVNNGDVTELNAKGYQLGEVQKQFINYVEQNVKEDDIVLIAGNPHDGDYNFMIDLAKLIKSKTKKLIFDCAKITLTDLKTIKPYAIKPNEAELEQLMDKKINSDAEVLKSCEQLLEIGVEHVFVSQGARGSIYVNATNHLKALPINDKVINTVGAGDSFVAGFIKAMVNQYNDSMCLELATACGSATTFNTNLASKENIDKYLKQVKIKSI